MAEDRWQLEDIANRVPGFRGYSTQDVRAEADQMLRAHLSKALGLQRDRIAEIELELMASGDSRAAQIDRIVMAFQAVIDSVDTPITGIDEWLGRVAIREDDLESIYRTDGLLLRKVDQIGERIGETNPWRSLDQSFAPLIGELIDLLKTMTEKLGHRQEIIENPLP
ncbi:MAG: hypothetical protein M1343_11845 [Chloroflexi bacterium]|nr:hypothetical protein [Chloroflexota bacterium]MDA8189158.1 hypothetical protein [Dehalococcoidales bacterium]